MALVSGVTMKILLNQFDMSGYLRSIAPVMERGMYDTTTFGAQQKQSIPGFVGGTIEAEGLWEETSTLAAPDNVFNAIEVATPVPLLTVAPEGLAVGKRLYILQSHKITHSPRARVDDLIFIGASFQSNNGFDFGLSLHGLTAETSFPFLGTGVDNTVATTNGGVGQVHVTAIAGGAPNVVYRIQHSTDGSAWSDLIVFTAITALTNGFQRVAVTGTVNRHLRMTITEGGTTSSVTGVVGFARR